MLVQGYTTQRKDPYASLDDARMRRAIAETKPKRAPGAKVAYSNYGYGLLGYALAHRAGTSYAELLHTRITGPLGLSTPRSTRPASRRATASSAATRTPGTSLRWRARAGCARPRATCSPTSPSTRGDGPLAEAARDTRVRRADMGKLGVGLAWIVLPADTGPSWAGFEARDADARRRHRRLQGLRLGRPGDGQGRRRARQPGALGDAASASSSCERCEPVGQHRAPARRPPAAARTGSPAPASQPSSRRCASWLSSSIPSATVRRPRLRPSWTSVWISASASGAETNVRSILSASTGSCCR